jgi:peptidoglycan-associated lipoprotein
VGGVQYLWVRGPAGSFKVALAEISQVEVVRVVGVTQVDWVRYDVKVTGKDPGVVRFGTMDLRVLRGLAAGQAWYYYPATLTDRGAAFWRIVVNDEPLEPTLPAAREIATPPPAAIAPLPAPRPEPVPEAPQELLTVDDLNAQKVLGDIFFDFDKADIRPDAEEGLERNAEWLKQWATTTVRVEGYADVRGTQEHNVNLGQERADAARQFLITLGVPAHRITMVSRGESSEFCEAQTERCWARNRRAHFVITSK